MEKTTYLSQIVTDDDLSKLKPGQFNIIKAPIGSGKTTFMFDERILKFARDRKHVLYLIQNKPTRNMIAEQHSDKAKVFADNNYNGWFEHRRKGVWTSEEDENYVHVMCYQTFAALLRNEGTEWLQDIDLIVWDEFDDVKSFYETAIEKLKKLLPSFSPELLADTLRKGDPKSVVNFIYQVKNIILDPGQILLIAVSATPECAALYFQSYINYIISGEIEANYVAKHTEWIKSVITAAREGMFKPDGRKYWCYTKFISDALAIEVAVRPWGLHPIVLWSENNINYQDKYTDEKREAIKSISGKGMVPPQYDFVITTGVLGRGISMYDETYQDWICNSDEYEDVHQFMRARFSPERQYLLESARGLVQFVQHGFPVEYYEWHSIKELKAMLEEIPIYTDDIKPKKITSISMLAEAYPNRVEKRRYGAAHQVQYRVKEEEDNEVQEDVGK